MSRDIGDMCDQMRRMVEVEGTVRPARPRPGDRDRAAVEAAARELGAQPDDPLPHGGRRPPRVGAWPTRARLEGLGTAFVVPAQQAMQVLL